VASGFFALFDDISVLMDDMATMSKVATKKTVGILGDDLAVTAEQASGYASSRELPVLWAIMKGSFVNKLIILPVAFLLSAFAPWAIAPILMLGGLYLAYEGMEKIWEYVFHKDAHAQKHEKLIDHTFTRAEILARENEKINSAIRTDFILSIEIVIIALGTVSGEPLPVQIAVVSLVAVLATIGVYGVVALLVRMDDFGYKLAVIGKEKNKFLEKIGNLLIKALPKVIKSLAVIGTIAMLLVAGGIFMHNIHALHVLLHGVPVILAELLVGAVAGILVLLPVELYQRYRGV
jgi:predicted DNA repair protein MutK